MAGPGVARLGGARPGWGGLGGARHGSKPGRCPRSPGAGRPGLMRQANTAWHGEARCGWARRRFGWAGHGPEWLGPAGLGRVRHGAARQGIETGASAPVPWSWPPRADEIGQPGRAGQGEARRGPGGARRGTARQGSKPGPRLRSPGVGRPGLMSWANEAGHGRAWCGKAGRGLVGQGEAGRGLAAPGEAWRGEARSCRPGLRSRSVVS